MPSLYLYIPLLLNFAISISQSESKLINEVVSTTVHTWSVTFLLLVVKPAFSKESSVLNITLTYPVVAVDGSADEFLHPPKINIVVEIIRSRHYIKVLSFSFFDSLFLKMIFFFRKIL
jgi:hypothetical protein